jgi:hypothetical protein
MVHKKLVKQIINWENTLSLPMNQSDLEARWLEKVTQILNLLSTSQDSKAGLIDVLRAQTLEPFSVLNVEKIRVQLYNYMSDQIATGRFMMQHASDSSLIQFCKTVASFKDSVISQIHSIAQTFINLDHELYPRLELPEICQELDRSLISEAYNSNQVAMRQLRAVLDMHISGSLEALSAELKKNIFETTREQWEKYNSSVNFEAEKIKALVYSDYGDIEESFIRYQIQQLSEQALHLLHEIEKYKTEKLVTDYEFFLESKLIDIIEGRTALFDLEYCKPEMKKCIARVVNHSLPLKKRVKYVADMERIYTIMNFDKQDMDEFYIETTESERLSILENSVKEWLRESEPGQRFFSLLCLVIGLSNAWTAIVNNWADSVEMAQELNALSYSPGRRELLRTVTKNLFECSFDHQTSKVVRYNEWSIVILAENLIAKVLYKLGRKDWVTEFVHENLAFKLNKTNQEVHLEIRPDPDPQFPIVIQEEHKAVKKSSIKSRFITLASEIKKSVHKRIKSKKSNKICKELTLECCKEVPSLHITLAISGWLSQNDEFSTSWDPLVNYPFQGRTYALRWESSNLNSLKSEIITAGGVLTILGLAIPVLLPLNAYLVAKSPFVKATKRAKLAGKALASFIKEDVFGKAPISLVAFSLGTSVVLHCLLQLSKDTVIKVHDVVLLGGAAPLDTKLWKRAKKAVSGRMINCYSKSDRILSVLYSAANLKHSIGNFEIKVKGVENYDVTHIAPGHQDYRNHLDKILQRIKYNT